MKKIFIGVLALCVLFFMASPALAQLNKIRFSTTSIAVTELQFRIAQLKGFYRDEGLDLETILIRGAVGMQALLGGSVDYSSAAGALIAAAVRGAPVRLVLIYDLHLSRLGGTSYLDEAWTRGAIEFTKKSLGVAKEIAPNQVFDFSFAEKARGGIKN